MKNKKLIIVVAVVVLLVGGFGLFKVFSKSGKNTNTSQNKTSESNSPKSLKDILSLGIAQKCTYDGGVIYINGSKFRGDFESISQEKTVKSHMIVDNNTSYVWTEGSTAGIKMAFENSDIKEGKSVESGNQNTNFDASAPLNYSCSAWIVDGSYFELPKGVAFSDMTTLFAPQPSSAGASGTPNSQCSYCGMLAGEEKSECLSSLNCN